MKILPTRLPGFVRDGGIADLYLLRETSLTNQLRISSNESTMLKSGRQ